MIPQRRGRLLRGRLSRRQDPLKSQGQYNMEDSARDQAFDSRMIGDDLLITRGTVTRIENLGVRRKTHFRENGVASKKKIGYQVTRRRTT